MSKINDTPDFLKMAQTLKKDVVRYAAREGKNFFVESFHNTGFTDKNFEAWDSSANNTGKVLTQSADLRDSVDVFERSFKRIVFGSDSVYAEIHNNGGVIPITKKSRKFFWAMFKETGETKWKAMALTKKQAFKIPKRQFIGESATLLQNYDQWLKEQIEIRFKQL